MLAIFAYLADFMFDKIKNPNAKPANIALAFLYIVVLLSLFANATSFDSSCDGESAREVSKSNNL